MIEILIFQISFFLLIYLILNNLKAMYYKKAFLVFIYIILISTSAHSTPNNVNNIKDIQYQINKSNEIIRSIYVDYVESIHYTDYFYKIYHYNINSMPNTQYEHYILATMGKNLYSKNTDFKNKKNISKFWQINSKVYQQSIQLGTPKYFSVITEYSHKDRTPRIPNALNFLMLDDQRNSNILLSNKLRNFNIIHDSSYGPLIHITIERPSPKNTNKQEVVELWIAKKYKYIVIKEIIKYIDGSNNETDMSIYKVKNLSRYKQFWFPKEYSYQLMFATSKAINLIYTRDGNIKKFIVNKLPENIFNVNLPANSVIYNRDNQIKYRVSANGRWIPVETNSPPSPTLPQRMPQWLFLISLFVMILIGLDAFQRWFRKRSRSS